MIPDAEQIAIIRDSAHYASLKEHPGFKLLLGEVQRVAIERWQSLLTCAPQELAGIQGFIEGANYFLEYADAGVCNARVILAQREIENHERTEQALQNVQAVQRTRGERRGGFGASLD